MYSKEDVETDKWYKRGDDFIYYTCESNNYGIMDGQWRNGLYFSTAQKQLYIPATDKEVSDALIKEAKRRYSKGCKITWDIGIVKNIDYEYYNSEDSYYPNSLQLGFVVLFQDGKWLEIIEKESYSHTLTCGGSNIYPDNEITVNGITYVKK